MDKQYLLKETLLGLILFTLPLSLKLNSLSIFVAFCCFFHIKIKRNFLGKLTSYWISFTFFSSQLISFILSENTIAASSKIILYLSFLLFPILFSSFDRKIKLEEFRLIRWLFYGTLLILCYGLLRSLYDVIFINERYDYGRGVGLLLKYVPHHAYLSMYIFISIIGVLPKAIERKRIHFWILVFIPPLYLALILLSSRTAILISVFIFPYIIYSLLKNVAIRKKSLIILIFTYLVLITIGFSNDFSRNKIIYTFYEIANISTTEKPFAGVTSRKDIWFSAIELVKQSPWIGYGVGDTQYVLDTYFSENNLEKRINMNTHNQYLQFALHHGILIASLLLAIIINLIRKLIINKYSFLVFCWFILLSFSMTETILNRQWGVVLFAFILNYSIYVLSFSTKEVSRI